MQKTCRNCQLGFKITQDDLDFYEKVSPDFGGKKYLIPPPTLCPDCRMQRRLTWRNERKLYNRKCERCHTELVSIYAAGGFPIVYCQKCYWSDEWDGKSMARDFDFSRPFFPQFRELMEAVPYPNLSLRAESENCEYTNLTSHNKNGYLIFAASNNEDCYYSTYLQRCQNVSDCFFIFDSELCYECVDCYGSYNLRFCQYVKNCRDSMYLYDCSSCSDCFGCVGLVNKQFHLFNQPLTKEEYQNRVEQIRNNPSFLVKAQAIFRDLQNHHPHKYYAGLNNENVTGDHISYSKNSFNSYDCTYLENCKYCTWLHRSKDCYDCYAWGLTGELGYENHLCGDNFYNVRFSADCWNTVSDLSYCYFCSNGTNNCFGCVGLKKGQYCILNKQYTKEEYEVLVPRIIEHMKKGIQGSLDEARGQAPSRIQENPDAYPDPRIPTPEFYSEWGEFFPMNISPFSYNETVAQEYFPLSKEKVLAKRLSWKDEDMISGYEGSKMEIPANIDQVSDEITKEILSCKQCGKNYKIILQELRFYRNIDIPVPLKCFNCRHLNRMKLRNPRKLLERSCDKCGKTVQTTYSLDRPEKVYCEECYLGEVY